MALDQVQADQRAVEGAVVAVVVVVIAAELKRRVAKVAQQFGVRTVVPDLGSSLAEYRVRWICRHHSAALCSSQGMEGEASFQGPF